MGANGDTVVVPTGSVPVMAFPMPAAIAPPTVVGVVDGAPAEDAAVAICAGAEPELVLPPFDDE